MFVIFCPYLLPKGIVGLTLFPFIILKNKEDKNNLVLMNHEKIHIRQQLELLVFPFYVLYLLDFCRQYFKFRNIALAYRNIVFEREAYVNEKKFYYLKNRRFWNFCRFF
jgi:hypothetical protein